MDSNKTKDYTIGPSSTVTLAEVREEWNINKVKKWTSTYFLVIWEIKHDTVHHRHNWFFHCIYSLSAFKDGKNTVWKHIITQSV